MFNDFSVDLSDLTSKGLTLEQALHTLKEKGASIVECIKAVHVTQQVSLGEAKDIVSSSQAWFEFAKAHEKFHDEIIEEFSREEER